MSHVTTERSITRLDAWQVRIPLATPYRLSKVYGTLTHSNAVLVRVSLSGGVEGWGEADPGGRSFTGDTAEEVMTAFRERAPAMIGVSVEDWVVDGRGRDSSGSLAAAIDVACHDALARARSEPVWRLLGEKLRDSIDVLWPTSSGTADADLALIGNYRARGFRTFMLKMGERSIEDELVRVHAVLKGMPTDAAVMVDANQGWTLDEALAFADGTAGLPLILIEQPVAAGDLNGLHQVRQRASCPVSVDESLQKPGDVGDIIKAGAASVFSIKISKNGGLANASYIASAARDAGMRVLMNSMIELGITQAASLHLGCTLDNLMDCGHAYMSTLRMADDVTDFSSWVADGTATLSDRPGLGVEVFPGKVDQYTVDTFHVS